MQQRKHLKHKFIYQESVIVETYYGPRLQREFQCKCGEELTFLVRVNDGEPALRTLFLGE